MTRTYNPAQLSRMTAGDLAEHAEKDLRLPRREYHDPMGGLLKRRIILAAITDYYVKIQTMHDPFYVRQVLTTLSCYYACANMEIADKLKGKLLNAGAKGTLSVVDRGQVPTSITEQVFDFDDTVTADLLTMRNGDDFLQIIGEYQLS